MAEYNQSTTLSNRDVIKLTNDFGQNEYYKLGRALGIDEEILNHLWDPTQKACALQLVLLWRDDLGPEDDQRAILIDKLLEVGLTDKVEQLLAGFPASPKPTQQCFPYSDIGTADKSWLPRTNDNILPGMTETPALPMKRNRKDSRSSSVFENSNAEMGALGSEPEQKSGSGQNGKGLDNLPCAQDDTDDSDQENYINVSNKVLRSGSRTFSVVTEDSNNPLPCPPLKEINLPEERQNAVSESKALSSPSTIGVETNTLGNSYLSEKKIATFPDPCEDANESDPENCTQICNERLESESTKASGSLSTNKEIPAKPPRGQLHLLVPFASAENKYSDEYNLSSGALEAQILQNVSMRHDAPQTNRSKQSTPYLNDKNSPLPDFDTRGNATEDNTLVQGGKRGSKNYLQVSEQASDLELSEVNASSMKQLRRQVKEISQADELNTDSFTHSEIESCTSFTKQSDEERKLGQIWNTENKEKENTSLLTAPTPPEPLPRKSLMLNKSLQGSQIDQDKKVKNNLTINSESQSTISEELPDVTQTQITNGSTTQPHSVQVRKECKEHANAPIQDESISNKHYVTQHQALFPSSDKSFSAEHPSNNLTDGHSQATPAVEISPNQQPEPFPKESPAKGTDELQPKMGSPVFSAFLGDSNDPKLTGASQEKESMPPHLHSTLPKPKGSKQLQALTSNASQRAGTLQYKAPALTPEKNADKQSSSFHGHRGVSEEVLRALAGDITNRQKLNALGIELGFKEADINGFEAMNLRTSMASMDGTFDMLLTWKSTVAAEDQTLLLKHALRRAGLSMAESHLKASKRRRDIRGLSIAKNFTVSDCREKLEFHYRTETCKGLKKHGCLNNFNYLPVINVQRPVQLGKNIYLERISLSEGSVKEILKTRKDGVLPNRIVIFGKSGIGKSTLVAQMAQDWVDRVPGSPLNDVLLLFVLKMKFMTNHGSLGQAIFHQLLSDVRGLTAQGIDQIIEDNQTECMVVLDGLDEFKGEISSIRCGHVLRVVQNIQLRTCRVIVTSHDRLQDYFTKEDLPKDFLKMELQGFSHAQITSFIRSFFEENALHKANEMIVFLETNEVIWELLATPLFCMLACHLWESNLLQLVSTESEFYDSINHFFLKHGEEIASMVSGDTDLDVIVEGIGEIALNAFLEDPKKKNFGQNDFKKIPKTLEKAVSIGIVSKTRSKKRDETGIEFYHHNAQEHCAAKYLSKEGTSKSSKGKQSRLDKALKQMSKKNLAEFGRILRLTAGLGSPSTALHVIETILSDGNISLGDKTKMVLECLAEIPQLDKQTTYAVERCIAGGNIVINLPTIHTTIGLFKLPLYVKTMVRSVTIQSSSMSDLVAKRFSIALQGCPDLLKLELADVQNAAYPVILLLINKLSLHLMPNGAMSVIPDLNQSIFDRLRLVDLSDCNLSPKVTLGLWTALARCPKIELMSVRNSSIKCQDLPHLWNITDLQANLRSPVLADEVEWLASILGNPEKSTQVKLTISDAGDESLRRAGLSVHEEILMVDDRVVLTNATENTIKVLNVLPDTYRRKVKVLCIRETRFTYDLTRPLLDIVHSLIRLEMITTEGCNIPDELRQLHVFKGSSQKHMNQLPTLGQDGVLRGSVSSPLREEDFERLSSVFNYSRTGTLNKVHLLIEHDRNSRADFREVLDIIDDNMELSNASSATVEVLKMLPASFKQKMRSARIKNCTLTDELSEQLSQTLKSMEGLEMFLSENSILGRKALHLTTVSVLDLGRFSSACFDWEWLANAALLEELHLTFQSSPPTTPTSPTAPVSPTTPTALATPTSAPFTGAKEEVATPFPVKNRIYEEISERMDSSATEGALDEDFFMQLASGRLVMTKMSSCSLSVMLHLPNHIKDQLRHVRVRSTKLSVDVLNRLSDVRQTFKHLKPLSLQTLYRRPVKYGCILQPGASEPVVGQWD